MKALKTIRILWALSVVCCLAFVSSCATQKKLQRLQNGETPQVQLTLGNQPDYLPKVDETSSVTRDTLKVKDDDGRELIVMKAIKDEESGEMVATDVIQAAKVTARFRNVAERNGRVDLAFQVIVPQSMRDSRWQLRFYPDMFMLGDSVRLDPVIITGAAYRKAQLRGYQMYEKFLSKIVNDSTKFINVRQLEIFLKRYIPQVFSYKTDTSFVSEQEFYSAYGVSERQAVEHYTNRFAKNLNERRKAKMDKMHRKYIKSPIVTEGIRLDTVMISDDGEFIYNYVQTINTRPKLKKVDIILSGEIYEQDKRLYNIPRSEPLTFYISSISAFVDNTERYLTKVVERRAMANTESRIDFELGKSDIKPEYGRNLEEIAMIERTLASLVENATYDLDSITVRATASPEGPYAVNRRLAQRRSESVSSWFGKYVKSYRDSLVSARGVFAELGSDSFKDDSGGLSDVVFTPRCIPENWDDLLTLVASDIVMNDNQKEEFVRICESEKEPDRREVMLRKCTFYNYMKETLYPRLRTVKFNFYLHRKGMVKDTIHTTVVDSLYMEGVQALHDMDYASALSRLLPYGDFNAAVACVGMDRNATAMKILESLPDSDKVNYLMAILYSRAGDYQNAVNHYLKACHQNPSFVFRGNLDPEIYVLIKTYGLNSQEEDPVFE
jgi:outer membrane protein OmpA-like peptidoglycan-associated protein